MWDTILYENDKLFFVNIRNNFSNIHEEVLIPSIHAENKIVHIRMKYVEIIHIYIWKI
jgi:hypothetical protein